MRALLVVVLALALPAPARAAEPGLAYAGGAGIVVAAADGSGTRALVAGGGEDRPVDPVWSPDGATLAFAWQSMILSSQYTPPPLVAMHRLGARRHPELPGERSGQSPAWSPDAAHLVIADNGGLPVVDVRTGERRTLTSGGVYDRDADVSADGRWVAFTRDHRTVWLVPFAGGDAVRLADGANPSWSPDGRKLAFSVGGDIAVHDLVAQTTDRIEGPGEDVEPDWSPDGRRILFSSNRDFPEAGSYEIHAMDPDGGCVTQLTWGAFPARQPDARPGVRAHRGACGRRAVRFRTPKISGRWLHAGRRIGPLLLSSYGKYVAYRDCARPGRCQRPLSLRHRSACHEFSSVPIARRWRRFGKAVLGRGRYEWVLATGARFVEVRGAGARPGRILRRLGALARPRLRRVTWQRIDEVHRFVRRNGVPAAARHYRMLESHVRGQESFRRAMLRAGAGTC